MPMLTLRRAEQPLSVPETFSQLLQRRRHGGGGVDAAGDGNWCLSWRSPAIGPDGAGLALSAGPLKHGPNAISQVETRIY